MSGPPIPDSDHYQDNKPPSNEARPPRPRPSPCTALARLETNGTWYYFGGHRGDSPPISLVADASDTVYYDHDFLVARIDPATQLLEPVNSTVANVFKELHRCFNCSFPFTGALQAFPADGQQLAPHGLQWPASWLPGPAIFYSRPAQDSYVIVAQDGEGTCVPIQ